jgi:HNH endonuclease
MASTRNKLATSKQELLEEFRDTVHKVGYIPSIPQWQKLSLTIKLHKVATYYNHFGGWTRLRKIAAGNNHNKTNSDERRVLIAGRVSLYKEKAPFEMSGHSIKGALEYDVNEDKVKCHECGKWCISLASHISRTHKRLEGISVADYKIKHGLLLKTALWAEDLRKTFVRASSARVTGATFLKFLDEKKKWLNSGKPYRPFRRKCRSVEVDNRNGLCQAQVLEKVKKIADSYGRTPTQKELQENGLGTHMLAYKFGSIQNMMKVLGLKPRKIGTYADESTRSSVRQRYSNKRLLELLRNYFDRFGEIPSASDCRRGLLPSKTLYRIRFGNWKIALIKAGLNPRSLRGPGGSYKKSFKLFTYKFPWAIKSKSGE